MIPFKTPWLIKKAFPSYVWDLKDVSQKQIYLTFDDGPIPEVTPYVLELLKRYNAKATFFCIGDNVRKHPEVFNQVIKDGHQIGNHTFNHLNGRYNKAEDYLNNIKLCDHELTQKGIQTDLFRPPYGRLKRQQRLQLTHKKIIMWDVLSQDYDQSITPENCLEGTLKATSDGSIVLFHDSLKAERNLRYTLPKFLEHFASKEYFFAKLPL